MGQDIAEPHPEAGQSRVSKDARICSGIAESVHGRIMTSRRRCDNI
ncbi:hypothetical protein GH722_06600 [Alphaproteobacteria bacterium HT1-32]|nr:hypothetical protein [Alphaproteobacteria bacterium HT1-32]